MAYEAKTIGSLPSIDRVNSNDLFALERNGASSKATGGQISSFAAEAAAEAIKLHSGTNLLDNWYFTGGGSQQGGGQFPINQRGETIYDAESATRYGIDRWKIVSGSKLEIQSDGLFLTKKTSSDQFILQYSVENFKSLAGKTVTLSLLYEEKSGNALEFALSDGVSYKIAASIPDGNGCISGSAVLSDNITRLWVAVRSSNASASAQIKIIAVKLELGSVQTLAHQENGKWVLNDPPPNYALELAKCQRYYWKPNLQFLVTPGDFFYNNERAAVNICFPVEMRAIPTIKIVSINGTDGILSEWSQSNDTDIHASPTLPSKEGFSQLLITNFKDDSFHAWKFRIVADADL